MLLNRLKALLNYISISGEIKKKQIFLGCPRIGGDDDWWGDDDDDDGKSKKKDK